MAKLLEKGFVFRVLVRDMAKAQKMFNYSLHQRVEIVLGDIRERATLSPAIENIDYIICCTGTTAFPSSRWEFESISPGQRLPSFLEWLEWLKIYFNRDYCISQAKNSPKKAERKTPFSILNLFGVLDAKEQGEKANSGIPYTIIRLARLIDGPFTSYDLNTLLKATTKGKLGLVIGTGDILSGQTSRIDVATACVECLSHPETENTVFELINQGKRPAQIDWKSLFSQLK